MATGIMAGMAAGAAGTAALNAATYLDMTVPLQARAREGQTLYFEIDGHLNRKGNRALADAVLGYLRDNAERLGLEPSSISKELPGAAQ